MKLNINDEQGIELLHFIFERELKPPFRKGKRDQDGHWVYYDRNGEEIGWLYSNATFSIDSRIIDNIFYKVCDAFQTSPNTSVWWFAINSHLKLWLGDQINVNLINVV